MSNENREKNTFIPIEKLVSSDREAYSKLIFMKNKYANNLLASKYNIEKVNLEYINKFLSLIKNEIEKTMQVITNKVSEQLTNNDKINKSYVELFRININKSFIKLYNDLKNSIESQAIQIFTKISTNNTLGNNNFSLFDSINNEIRNLKHENNKLDAAIYLANSTFKNEVALLVQGEIFKANLEIVNAISSYTSIAHIILNLKYMITQQFSLLITSLNYYIDTKDIKSFIDNNFNLVDDLSNLQQSINPNLTFRDNYQNVSADNNHLSSNNANSKQIFNRRNLSEYSNLIENNNNNNNLSAENVQSSQGHNSSYFNPNLNSSDLSKYQDFIDNNNNNNLSAENVQSSQGHNSSYFNPNLNSSDLSKYQDFIDNNNNNNLSAENVQSNQSHNSSYFNPNLNSSDLSKYQDFIDNNNNNNLSAENFQSNQNHNLDHINPNINLCNVSDYPHNNNNQSTEEKYPNQIYSQDNFNKNRHSNTLDNYQNLINNSLNISSNNTQPNTYTVAEINNNNSLSSSNNNSNLISSNQNSSLSIFDNYKNYIPGNNSSSTNGKIYNTNLINNNLSTNNNNNVKLNSNSNSVIVPRLTLFGNYQDFVKNNNNNHKSIVTNNLDQTSSFSQNLRSNPNDNLGNLTKNNNRLTTSNLNVSNINNTSKSSSGQSSTGAIQNRPMFFNTVNKNTNTNYNIQSITNNNSNNNTNQFSQTQNLFNNSNSQNPKPSICFIPDPKILGDFSTSALLIPTSNSTEPSTLLNLPLPILPKKLSNTNPLKKKKKKKNENLNINNNNRNASRSRSRGR